MTEQELRVKLKEAHAEWAIGKIGYAIKLVDHLMPICKAYADARVAQECKVLDEVVTLLHQTIANRNVEIAELKTILSQSQQMYTDLLVGTTDAISAKDSEIKRLRDGVASVMDRFNFPTEARDSLNALLTPPLVSKHHHSSPDGRPMSANIIDARGISMAWLQVASEFENWGGDIQRKERMEEMLFRLQSRFVLYNAPVTEREDVDILDYCDTLCARKGWNKRYEIGPNVFLKIIENGDHEIWNEDQESVVCEIAKGIIPNDSNTWIASVLLGFTNSDWASKNKGQ